MRLEKVFRFEAAHDLPNHKGKCNRLHGHSWVLHVFVEGVINPETGMVMDYGDIKSAYQPLYDGYLDHYYLNLWLPNPTSENLLVWIGEKTSWFPWSALSLEETCTSSAYLTRKEFDETHGKEREEDGKDGKEDAQETQEVTTTDEMPTIDDDDIPF